MLAALFRAARALAPPILTVSLLIACDDTTDDAADAMIDVTPDAMAPDGTPWHPAPGTTWQWQLSEDIDPSFDVAMYDVDLVGVDDATFDALRADGRVLICYFSAGSLEDGRPDEAAFPAEAVGERLIEWPGERWVDVRHPGIRDAMRARLDLAVARGCDGVEPDNVDGYTHPTGFDFTADDQRDFNRFLAREAHARGLSVGLKNALDLVPDLVDDFDWALNEECAAYEECATLQPFIAAGKAVFHVEYVDDIAEGPAMVDIACNAPGTDGFSTLVKRWDLDAWVLTCPE